MGTNLRYPGTKPFETYQQDIFKGRDLDIVNFFRLVKLEQLVVLHGKSGLGKSSLLNAGITPLVEKKNYDAIRVRFQAHQPSRSEKSPLLITQESIRKQSQPQSTFLDQLILNEASIWHDIKEHQILNRGNKGLVLIFDQFEELFTYPEDQVIEFAENMAEVILGIIPQRYWDAMERISDEDESVLEQSDLEVFQSDMNIKVIISIRSDQLHLLDQIKVFLPSIHQHTYVLEPLTREGATSAIVEPGKMQGDFITPPLEYEEAALNEVLDYLSQDGQEDIESNQLQIVCEALEKKAHSDGSHVVKLEHTNKLKEIVQKHYEEKIESLPEEYQQDVRIMIQEGLVFTDEENQRRLSLFEGVILSEYNITTDILNQLVNSHLLRREIVRGDTYYELSHDTLLVPVIKARDLRREDERKEREKEELRELRAKEMKKIEAEWKARNDRQKYMRRTIMAVLLSLIAFAIYASITNRNLNRAKIEALNAKLEAVDYADSLSQSLDSLEKTKAIVEQEREDKDSLATVNERMYQDAKKQRDEIQRIANRLLMEQAQTTIRRGDDFMRYQEHRFAKTAYLSAIDELKKISPTRDSRNMISSVQKKIAACNHELNNEKNTKEQ